MAYIAVEMPWFGSFCQSCIVTRGARMHRHGGLLTETGREGRPGLVLAFREGGALWVEQDTFNEFAAGLTLLQLNVIENGGILFLT